jgi:hypothetical protein
MVHSTELDLASKLSIHKRVFGQRYNFRHFVHSMRILIYGINYWPERTGIGKYTGEMGAWLAQQAGNIVYNTDEQKVAFHNGSGWNLRF